MAAAADRTTGAFYDHFGNKEGLLLGLVELWVARRLQTTHAEGRPPGPGAAADGGQGLPSPPGGSDHSLMTRSTLTGRSRAATLALTACVLTALFAAPSSGLTGRVASSAGRAQDPNSEVDTSDGSLKSQYDEVLGREAAVLQALSQAQAARLQATDRFDKLVAQTVSKQVELVQSQQALSSAEQRAALQVEARRQAERRVARAVTRLRRQAVASFVRGGERSGVAQAVLHVHNGQQAGQAVAYGRAALGDSDRLVRELRRARSAQRMPSGQPKRPTP